LFIEGGVVKVEEIERDDLPVRSRDGRVVSQRKGNNYSGVASKVARDGRFQNHY
jgi:hypothetical protein